MGSEAAVASHYSSGSLLEAIRGGVEGLGKTPETVSVDDLAPVDARSYFQKIGW